MHLCGPLSLRHLAWYANTHRYVYTRITPKSQAYQLCSITHRQLHTHMQSYSAGLQTEMKRSPDMEQHRGHSRRTQRRLTSSLNRTRRWRGIFMGREERRMRILSLNIAGKFLKWIIIRIYRTYYLWNENKNKKNMGPHFASDYSFQVIKEQHLL